MNNSNTFITATEARNKFFDLLGKVKKGPYPVNITVNGIPEAVIMSKDDFDGWMATIETLSDPELMKQIRQSEKDFKAGKYEDWEDVKKELGVNKSYLVADKSAKKYVSGQIKHQSKKGNKKAR